MGHDTNGDTLLLMPMKREGLKINLKSYILYQKTVITNRSIILSNASVTIGLTVILQYDCFINHIE